jgi:uncharacterized MnhB-related membrane protein
MIWQVDFWLLLLLIGIAVIALEVRDLMASVVALGAYSFLIAVVFAGLGAVDVAFTEAVLGAGVVGVLLITALFAMDRRSVD